MQRLLAALRASATSRSPSRRSDGRPWWSPCQDRPRHLRHKLLHPPRGSARAANASLPIAHHSRGSYGACSTETTHSGGPRRTHWHGVIAEPGARRCPPMLLPVAAAHPPDRLTLRPQGASSTRSYSFLGMAPRLNRSDRSPAFAASPRNGPTWKIACMVRKSEECV